MSVCLPGHLSSFCVPVHSCVPACQLTLLQRPTCLGQPACLPICVAVYLPASSYPTVFCTCPYACRPSCLISGVGGYLAACLSTFYLTVHCTSSPYFSPCPFFVCLIACQIAHSFSACLDIICQLVCLPVYLSLSICYLLLISLLIDLPVCISAGLDVRLCVCLVYPVILSIDLSNCTSTLPLGLQVSLGCVFLNRISNTTFISVSWICSTERQLYDYSTM
jgi:hypothetical protein